MTDEASQPVGKPRDDSGEDGNGPAAASVVDASAQASIDERGSAKYPNPEPRNPNARRTRRRVDSHLSFSIYLIVLSLIFGVAATYLYVTGAPGAPDTARLDAQLAGSRIDFYSPNGFNVSNLVEVRARPDSEGDMLSVRSFGLAFDGQPPVFDVVFAFTGAARLDPDTITLNPDASEGARIESVADVINPKISMVLGRPALSQIVTVRVENPVVFLFSFSLDGQLGSPIRSTNNARTYAVTPAIGDGITCAATSLGSPPLDPGFWVPPAYNLTENYIPPGCTTENAGTESVGFAEGTNKKIDFASADPVPGRLEWRGVNNSMDLQVSVNYVDLTEEALGGRRTFISGVLIGLASAAFPIGAEMLVSEVIARRRTRREISGDSRV